MHALVQMLYSLASETNPVREDVQKDLNAVGIEGWELVTVQNTSLPDGSIFTVAWLKRVLESE